MNKIQNLLFSLSKLALFYFNENARQPSPLADCPVGSILILSLDEFERLRLESRRFEELSHLGLSGKVVANGAVLLNQRAVRYHSTRLLEAARKEI